MSGEAAQGRGGAGRPRWGDKVWGPGGHGEHEGGTLLAALRGSPRALHDEAQCGELAGTVADQGLLVRQAACLPVKLFLRGQGREGTQSGLGLFVCVRQAKHIHALSMPSRPVA